MNQRNFLILFFVVCTFYLNQAEERNKDIERNERAVRIDISEITTGAPEIHHSAEISTRTTINDIRKGGNVEETNYSDGNRQINDFKDLTTTRSVSINSNDYSITTSQQGQFVRTEAAKIHHLPKISTRTTINDIEKGGEVEEINYSDGNSQINNFDGTKNSKPKEQFTNTDPLKIYMQIPKINVTRLTYNEIQKDGKVEEINHTGGNIQINNFVRPQNENSTPQFDSKAYDDFMKSLFDPSITTTEKSILHDERTQNILSNNVQTPKEKLYCEPIPEGLPNCYIIVVSIREIDGKKTIWLRACMDKTNVPKCQQQVQKNGKTFEFSVEYTEVNAKDKSALECHENCKFLDKESSIPYTIHKVDRESANKLPSCPLKCQKNGNIMRLRGKYTKV
ncbi:hypothetical protein PVAND_015982 [Polypedilum vanderplanki]|uniref:Uncharacterized protein n=1 Tax=Polypedilum vanderplanki TaxID=319348 RepID=A0A9J6BDS5_POLVA|nr:hypothetical protein PVAND_015982 [Polypedilum vanderplanki]